MRKKQISVLAVGVLVGAFSLTAEAREKNRFEDQVPELPSPPSRKAIGVSSYAAFNANTALTGAIELDTKTLVQGFFAVPSASPLMFILGGTYKATIHDHGVMGLHVGAGASLGLARKAIVTSAAEGETDFFVELGALGGIHVPFPGVSNLMIHLDAGPAVHIQKDANDFAVGTYGGILGASVLYYF